MIGNARLCRACVRGYMSILVTKEGKFRKRPLRVWSTHFYLLSAFCASRRFSIMRPVNHVFFFLSSWSAYVPNIFFVHVLAMSHTKTHVHCTQTNTRAIRKTFDMIHRIAHESHDSTIERIPRKSTAQPLLRAKRIRRFALKIWLDFQESYDRSFFLLCTCFMQ